MTRNMRLLASASVLAATAVAASPAYAAGTSAGTTVTNSVTLDYKVGGVDQNQVTASDTFTVDRKVNLTVVETGNLATSVSPGQVAAVTTFAGKAAVATDDTIERWARIAPPADLPVPLHGD